MGQGKPGKGTRQHGRATPYSSPCQNEQRTSRWCWISARTSTYTWYVRMKKCVIFFPVFYLILVRIPPWSGGLRNTRFVSRGLIRMRFKNVARRDKTEQACERRICPSLSRPFVEGPTSSLCSCLVVEGVLRVIRTRYLDTRTYSWTTLHVFPSFFFGWFFLTNTRGLFAVASCCCICTILSLFTFLRQRVCATAAWWLYY